MRTVRKMRKMRKRAKWNRLVVGEIWLNQRGMNSCKQYKELLGQLCSDNTVTVVNELEERTHTNKIPFAISFKSTKRGKKKNDVHYDGNLRVYS